MRDEEIRRALRELDRIPVQATLPPETLARARRRRAAFLAVFGTLVAVVAAALVFIRVDRPRPDPTPVAPPSLPEVPNAIEELCRNSEYGCAELSPGEPVRLATLLDESGTAAALGIDSRRGALLAADYIDGSFDGTEGKLFGHPITFEHKDEGCDVRSGAHLKARDLAAPEVDAGDRIIAVIGTTCSSTGLGVSDHILGSSGILLFSPSATASGFADRDIRSPFFFRTAHNETLETRALAEFARNELHAETASVLGYEGGFEIEAFATEFRRLGGEIVGDGAITVRTQPAELIADLAASDDGEPPDVLVLALGLQDAADYTKAARRVGLESALLLREGSTDYVALSGEAAEGVYVVEADTGFASQFYNAEFLPAYRERFGRPMSVGHAHAFDATMIILNAIQDVAVKDGDTIIIPRAELRAAIVATKNYPGIVGSLSCGERGDCNPNAPMLVRRLDDYPDGFSVVWRRP